MTRSCGALLCLSLVVACSGRLDRRLDVRPPSSPLGPGVDVADGGPFELDATISSLVTAALDASVSAVPDPATCASLAEWFASSVESVLGSGLLGHLEAATDSTSAIQIIGQPVAELDARLTDAMAGNPEVCPVGSAVPDVPVGPLAERALLALSDLGVSADLRPSVHLEFAMVVASGSTPTVVIDLRPPEASSTE